MKRQSLAPGLAVVAVVALLLGAPERAWTRTLDPTFGDDGIATVRVGVGVSHCWAIARQPDGALVLAGGAEVDDRTHAYHATLARLLPDGRLDPSFGEDGIVRGGDDDVQETSWRAVAIAPDGSILTAGYEVGRLGGSAHAIVGRFTSSGQPDPTFGEAGRVYVGHDRRSVAVSVVPEPDGGLAVGTTLYFPEEQPGEIPGFETHNDLALVRLRSDGSLDPTFGDGGVRIVDEGAVELAVALVRQSDGSLVLTSALLDETTLEYDVAVLRYDATGRRDESFGDGGRTLLDLGFLDYNVRVRSLPDDALLLLSGAPGLVLARLDRDGHLDADFGDGGIARAGLEGWNPRAVTVDGRGRPLVGFDSPEPADDGEVVRVSRLVRFTRNGRPLGRFKRGGIALPFEPSHMVFQPDGKLQAVSLNGARDWWATRVRRVGAPLK